MTNSKDLSFLEKAVKLSRESLENGGFPAAAILVRDGSIISQGLSSTETTHDITAHGEVQAIRAAGTQAISPLTLYSSLEPCLMCLAASACAGVTRIVYGCRRSLVDSSYYVNAGDINETVRLLVDPPELLRIENFDDEVILLIEEYQRRMS